MDETTAALKPLNTPSETAAFVSRTVSALANDRYFKRGIPYVRVGRSIRYSRESIAAYLEANRSDRVAS